MDIAEILHVYKDKNDALKVVKKYKKARFKAFKSHHDAVAFSLQGIEPSIDKDNSHSVDTSESGNCELFHFIFLIIFDCERSIILLKILQHYNQILILSVVKNLVNSKSRNLKTWYYLGKPSKLVILKL